MYSYINDQLDHTLQVTHLSSLGKRYQGKVRDTYDRDDLLILVTSDRISAFDHILRQSIPFKGQVLNQLAAFFFELTSDIVPNHVIAVPDPNVTIARKCKTVPIEFVVRGYLAGHAWREYRAGKRVLCGQPLPDGLRQNSKLPTPILTPATKAEEGHDEDISRAEILERGVITASSFDYLENTALSLFTKGTEIAAKQGLILVDTKYEFGKSQDGQYLVIDEVHTPDSSRYFYQDTYDILLAADKPQRQLSKEFVREWLMDNNFQGKEGQILPDIPDDMRANIAARYIELYEKITGRTFIPDTSTDPTTRVKANLSSYFTS